MYDSEVRRATDLQAKLEKTDFDLANARKELDRLRSERKTLEMSNEEREREKNELQSRFEDQRIGRLQLEEQLETERLARATADAEVKKLSGSYQNLVDSLEQEVTAGRLEIQRLEGRLQVRALDKILFDSGSASLKRDGRKVLERVAEQIIKIPGQRVRVEGHTDDVPISTAKFPSNWELSAARAAQVVRFFEEAGMEPRVLEAVGYGPNRPIAENDSAQNKSRNRRIEIILVPIE